MTLTYVLDMGEINVDHYAASTAKRLAEIDMMVLETY